jgi:UDP-N-acetylglucosamine transferase subunit ALG13
MAQLVATADLVVTHSGVGTVTAALVAGTPLIAIPQALDHSLTALRISAAGVGMAFNNPTHSHAQRCRLCRNDTRAHRLGNQPTRSCKALPRCAHTPSTGFGVPAT